MCTSIYTLYGLQLTFIYFLFQYLSLVLIKIPFNYKINLNEQESDEVDPRLSSIRDTSFSWESIDSQAGSRQSLLDNKGRCRLLSVSQSRLGAIQVRLAGCYKEISEISPDHCRVAGLLPPGRCGAAMLEEKLLTWQTSPGDRESRGRKISERR